MLSVDSSCKACKPRECDKPKWSKQHQRRHRHPPPTATRCITRRASPLTLPQQLYSLDPAQQTHPKLCVHSIIPASGTIGIDQRQMMKVFINFGTVRCVVPVGDGSLSVREVIDLAVERYRKATSNSKVIIA